MFLGGMFHGRFLWKSPCDVCLNPPEHECVVF
jgi:hypothetical protein